MKLPNLDSLGSGMDTGMRPLGSALSGRGNGPWPWGCVFSHVNLIGPWSVHDMRMPGPSYSFVPSGARPVRFALMQHVTLPGLLMRILQCWSLS